MDYRKPVTFGDNWSPSRYKVLPYFVVEKSLLSQEGSRRILDLGCANGWNMSRFAQYGRTSIGLDMVPERVYLALNHGPALVASGLEIPVADATFDVVYIQHVLHHIGDVEKAFELVHKSQGLEQTRFLAKKHCLEAVRLANTLAESPYQKGLIVVSDLVINRMK